ncbi:cysteine protease [Tieghemiomyces parasiticus]|uniref:Cysteine protease n=1 Tax=Tieghemiomyces parasiticus TaxID=78921 RepID=A0A9W8DXA3_9FUNG|nr:cysteine protease [Tieghemiomyces parasiticus]
MEPYRDKPRLANSRADPLANIRTTSSTNVTAQNDGEGSPSNWRTQLERAEELKKQATTAEGKGDLKQAVVLLCEAADLQLKAYTNAQPSVKKAIRQTFNQSVEKATALKQQQSGNATPATDTTLTPAAGPSTDRRTPSAPLHHKIVESSSVCAPALLARPVRATRCSQADKPGLGDDEVEVLRRTSYINGMVFLPWSEGDSSENFTFSEPFVDKDGPVALSQKQRARWGSWKRPKEFMSHPAVIKHVSCHSIIQEVVTDCSFVASLCVAAAYEGWYQKRLITSCIYPQDAAGQPVYNPSGKYVVRLLYNGIWRKVAVDDQFPVARDGRLMCTYTQNRTELWPSLIEKAYMKLMGGYDFPGSNSSIDLYTLTGWIPEQILMREDSFNPETQWQRLYQGLQYGDTLVTVATGEMDDATADTHGLVASHAYAVLKVEIVDGVRLLQLKNPWNTRGWKGAYSASDRTRWTPALCQRLQYDPSRAGAKDDGLFWIDYESLVMRFSSIHLNWNPELFTYRFTTHALWSESQGGSSAFYNLANNPQYTLTVEHVDGGGPAGGGTVPVWLLLTKHITQKEENRDYISMFVFDKARGERVYSPELPFVSNDFINSPNVLVRFNAEPGISHFTVVALQFKKTRDLPFTVRGFSMAPLRFVPVPRIPYQQVVAGRWTTDTAGGSPEFPGYFCNPQYHLHIPADDASKQHGQGMITLETDTDKHVNLCVVRAGGYRVTQLSYRNTLADSGPYTESTCFCPLPALDPGNYTVIASTHQPGQLGDYKITFDVHSPFEVHPIPAEGAGQFKRIAKGAWEPGISAAGHAGNPDFARNPRFLVEPATGGVKGTGLATPGGSPLRLSARLQALDIEPVPAINLTLLELPEQANREGGHELATSGPYVTSRQGALVADVTLSWPPPAGTRYALVPSTWEAGVAGRFQILVYTDKKVDITQADGI